MDFVLQSLNFLFSEQVFRRIVPKNLWYRERRRSNPPRLCWCWPNRRSASASLFSPVGKCSIDDEVRTHLERFRKMVGLAKVLGTDRIRVFPFCRSGYREYERSRLDEYIEHIAEKFQPLLDMATENSLTLVFECVGATLARTAKDLKRVFDSIGIPECARAVWEIDVTSKDGESPREGYPHLRGLIFQC